MTSTETTQEKTRGVSKDAPLALRLQNISKTFGLVKANQNIDLEIPKGTIHGIIGENGAGKSTLMNILYGFYQSDSGTFDINGQSIKLRSTADAIAQGIGMVHQHFMLVPRFTVMENILLGSEGGGILKHGKARIRDIITNLGDDFAKGLELTARVEDLPVGLQQRVEIIKALKEGASILILDEPTGVLTPQEADELFGILKNLRDKGVTILLITHKLQEIMAITDNVSVMRRGEMVAHRETSKTSEAELAELMVGRKVLLDVKKDKVAIGEDLLNVDNCSLIEPDGQIRFQDVSFSIKAGEILGIAGVAGNGQSALLEALAGIKSISSGQIKILDTVIDTENPKTPADLRDIGVAHIPEDRHKRGLVLKFKALENGVLGYHEEDFAGSGMFLDYSQLEARMQKQMDRYDIRSPNPHLTAKNFSGGNQQKIVIARELDTAPKILLIGQPTRGVDIGAIEFIHRQIVNLRKTGCAILLVSVELDEILSLSDRIMVMNAGKVVGLVDRADANEQKLGLLMAGISEEQGA